MFEMPFYFKAKILSIFFCNKNRFCQSSRSCFARRGTLGLLCIWLLALRAMVLQLFLSGGWGFCSFKKFSGVDLKHVFISVFTPIYPSLRYQSISGVNTPPPPHRRPPCYSFYDDQSEATCKMSRKPNQDVLWERTFWNLISATIVFSRCCNHLQALIL